MNRNKSVLLVAACLSCALPCTAALVPVAPVGGKTVDMLPAAQKKVMSLPTLSERIRLFEEDKMNGDALRTGKEWRKAAPVVLKWRTTDGEKGPWKIEIGKDRAGTGSPSRT